MKHLVTLAIAGILCLCYSCGDSATEPRWVPTGWEDQAVGTDDDLIDIHFLDNQHGWVLSRPGGVGKTSDGGRTWTWYAHGDNQLRYVKEICFSDSDNGWILTSDRLFHSPDGGATWAEKKYYDLYTHPFLHHLQFVDAQHGWFHNEYEVFRTVDGGATWSYATVTSIDNDYVLRDVHFIDTQHGWAVGAGTGVESTGVILSTMDGGEHWNMVATGELPELTHIHFVDAQHGWAGGSRTILRTTDGGDTWQSLPYISSHLIVDMTFADDSNGWVIIRPMTVLRGSDSSPVLCHTQDGGDTWTYQNKVSSLPYPANMSALHFNDAQHGWAVGTHGTVWHTTTGGRP